MRSTPGFMSQVVEGMDSLLRQPGGCFEQTTSSAWPNVLATDYLAEDRRADGRDRHQGAPLHHRRLPAPPDVRVRVGRLQLVGGRQPGQRRAHGGRHHDVHGHEEHRVRRRPGDRARREAPANAQQLDGSWTEERHLHAGNENLGAGSVRASAYITWALLHAGRETATTDRALAFLRSKIGESQDIYTTAMMTLALSAKNPNDPALGALTDRLHAARIEEGQRTYWSPDEQTMVGGWDDSGDIDDGGRGAGADAGRRVRGGLGAAIDWLLSKKDPNGNWATRRRRRC